MSISEDRVRGFEDELADALDAIVAVLAAGETLSSGHAAAQALQAYLGQQRRITAAAGRRFRVGLPTACVFMEANLLDMIGRGTSLSEWERGALEAWPMALVEYAADPSCPAAVEAVVACLSDSNWASPLSGEDGLALGQLMLSPPHIAESESKPVPEQPEPLSTSALDLTRPGAFTPVPYATRIDWMADLAARNELTGMLECCERVREAIAIWVEQDRIGDADRVQVLEEYFDLAKEALGAGIDAQLGQALIETLCKPSWPQPLSGDELELVQELLQADILRETAMSLDDGDSTALHESCPVIADIPAPCELPCSSEQRVNREFVALLAQEASTAQEVLRAGPVGDPHAIEAYLDEIDRLGNAADAVGLTALCQVLLELAGNVREHVEMPGWHAPELLAALPDALDAYLASPGDPGSAEVLVELLRSDVWASAYEPEVADALLAALTQIVIVDGEPDAPARPVEASEEDASLAVPDDVSPELLEGLLLELPIQTGELCRSIQHIAGKAGTLDDLRIAKRAAHTLKGAANTVGVRGIANLTHHLEDILIALSTQETMPNPALGDSLLRASDCLEAMSEAVSGTAPAPDDSRAVLQDILNWANSIDRDGIPEASHGPAPTVAGVVAEPQQEVPSAPQSGEAMVRVPAALIDELLRLLGETMISTGQIRDRIAKVTRNNLSQRAQIAGVLGLTGELEELVDLGAGIGATKARPGDDDFDPLEFENYGELHTLSRRLIEATTDAREVGTGIDEDFTELRELAEAQERLHQQMQSVVLQTRMVPVSTVVSRLQRSVRQACRLLDKEVTLEISGEQTPVDSNILSELIDPLMHILRNAVDHGIEPARERASMGKPEAGSIKLDFAREGNQLVVRCHDDGSGLDFEAIRRSAISKSILAPGQAPSEEDLSRLILAPGFSTRDAATQVSGRGLGMDIVKSRVQQMKGSLNLNSQRGKGLTVELRLPAALISTHALIVRTGSERVALSSRGILDIHHVSPEQLQLVAGSPTYRFGDTQLPVLEFATLIGAAGERRSETGAGFPMIIVRPDSGATRAVAVHEVLQSRNLVVKALGAYAPKVRGVVGATILGDGGVAAVVDLPELLDAPAGAMHADAIGQTAGEGERQDGGPSERLRALVVDDSLSARRATAQVMRDAGYEVRTAIDGLDAVAILAKWTPDVMLVDMEMPRMNGLELTSHVRAGAGEAASIPIVMITSRSTAKHRAQAESAGVSAYLTKPFSDDELLRHVAGFAADCATCV